MRKLPGYRSVYLCAHIRAVSDLLSWKVEGIYCGWCWLWFYFVMDLNGFGDMEQGNTCRSLRPSEVSNFCSSAEWSHTFGPRARRFWHPSYPFLAHRTCWLKGNLGFLNVFFYLKNSTSIWIIIGGYLQHSYPKGWEETGALVTDQPKVWRSGGGRVTIKQASQGSDARCCKPTFLSRVLTCFELPSQGGLGTLSLMQNLNFA